jgi:hypothetical protein
VARRVDVAVALLGRNVFGDVEEEVFVLLAVCA